MNPKHFAYIGDTASVGIIMATIAGWLPPLAALFALVYTCIQIWESKTVTKWRQRRSSRKRVLKHLIAERELEREAAEAAALRRLQGRD